MNKYIRNNEWYEYGKNIYIEMTGDGTDTESNWDSRSFNLGQYYISTSL